MSTVPSVSAAETDAFLARSRAKTRRFRLRFRLLLVFLFGVWILSGFATRWWEPGDWRRVLLCFAPAVPLALLIWFMRRSAPHLDEMGRRVVVEGAAWGMAVALPLSFLCSLARNAGLEPPMDYLTLVLTIMWAACGVGMIRAGRRLR